MEKPESKKPFIIAVILISCALALSLGFGGYLYYALSSKLEETEKNLALKSDELKERNSELTKALNENNALSEALYTEQNKNQEFEDQIREIAGTVGFLEKLSATDEELLQKYSKVYFLNEHYVPDELVQIPAKHVYPKDSQKQIHAKVFPYLEDLIDDAKKDGVDLKIISAFRSFYDQASVKHGHVVTYGAGTANQFSAEQGYSEHQLGTTVDFTTPETGANFSLFKNTEAYEWLQDNAHRYGFTLSYPENNTYYQFEPWHWRFVGEKLAKKLHRDGEYFYDMDQREINEYLVEIFD